MSYFSHFRVLIREEGGSCDECGSKKDVVFVDVGDLMNVAGDLLGCVGGCGYEVCKECLKKILAEKVDRDLEELFSEDRK